MAESQSEEKKTQSKNKIKRFYNDVSIVPLEASSEAEGPRGWSLQLDERVMRTPRRDILALPTHPLAELIAQEWRAQGEYVEPDNMPFTKLANTVQDNVVPRRGEVIAELTSYGGSDLLCYCADNQSELRARQQDIWQPLLNWAEQELDVRLVQIEGVMPKAQDPAALANIKRALDAYSSWHLGPMHVMTTITSSAILCLALAHGHISFEQAWQAAHIDEDWQSEQWGEDSFALKRRKDRLDEIQAAHTFFLSLS